MVKNLCISAISVPKNGDMVLKIEDMVISQYQCIGVLNLIMLGEWSPMLLLSEGVGDGVEGGVTVLLSSSSPRMLSMLKDFFFCVTRHRGSSLIG